MANKTIPQLPEQTGKTDNDLLAIVDSGETTTSKIKISTLLAGVGGGSLLKSTTGNTYTTDNYDPNTFTDGGAGQMIIGGTGHTIENTSSTSYGGVIIGGKDHTLISQQTGCSIIAGGENHNIGRRSNHCGIFAGLSNTITDNNAYDYGVIVGGRSNTFTGSDGGVFGGGNNSIQGSWGALVGGNNLSFTSGRYVTGMGGIGNAVTNSSGRAIIVLGGTDNTSATSGYNGSLLGGDSNTLSNPSENSSIVGGTNNTTSHDRCVILGGDNLTTSFDDEVLCEHLTTSGQSRGNFYNNLSGDTFTIDWDEGNLQKIYMTGDTSLTLSNVKNGATYKLQVENGGTHSITGVTASGFTILCEGGSIPNITNNGVDLCVLEVMDTDILVRHFADFSAP